MTETRDQGTATQELQRRLHVDNGNLYRPPVQASVKRARGSADWRQRILAAVFVGAVLVDLLIAGVVYLFARHVLWGHG